MENAPVIAADQRNEGNSIRDAGIHLRLPRRLPNEGVLVYDEHGNERDNLRSR